ncbi:DUF3999 family protein [Pontibacter actiniarum]|uniref:DUF3999 domain-containing protein n=1 Tax=Pontibacter actiniarum TaxID=323450 RepID=A0A1X9YUP8_9BACT|nr:DUF3999 family protein [Pontibacter actiniarum]ARS36514.1 hypothetical protein CA264_14335 [Pontibacter actiniarum]
MLRCKNIVLYLFLYFAVAPVVAQPKYKRQATVPAPAQSGYHRILLPPAVTGYLQPNLADLRLYDRQQQEIPYLLRQEERQRSSQTFSPYNIVHYTHKAGCCSELLIENTAQRQISNLSLLIKNADVQKQVSLSGSNNRESWYVLKAQDVLHTINSTENTAQLKLLEFPLNDYRYLRLQLNDSSNAPLNILQAGYYNTSTEEGTYTVIPVQQTTRTDSSAVKRSYIHLTFEYPVYPELLQLQVTAPDLYLRNGHVILGKAAEAPQRKRRRKKDARQPVTESFILSSGKPATIELPKQQVQELTVVIENEDNLPLSMSDIKVLQLNRYLVANLAAGEKYTLRFGSKDATAPAYDLPFFRGSIPTDLPILIATNITAVEEHHQAKGATSKVLLWAAIGVVVAGLGYMTVRLLNEMNRERSQRQ